MSKFTPGKWVLDALNGVTDSTGETPRIVCLILTNRIDDDYPTEEEKANGRLIAAAPEMYELLKVWATIGVQPTLNEARDKARELLARIDNTQEAQHE